MEDADENVFSCCNIVWKIENFCFANLFNDSAILSPEFILQGVKSAKWRMSLELDCKSSSDGQISFYLEKLPISKEKHVSVNWELTIKAGNKDFGPYRKKVEFGEQSKYGEIGVATVTEILNCLIPIEPDIVSVHLYFVAFHKDMHFTPRAQHDDGLFNLSKDLSKLKLTKNYSDINIKVNDRCIEAHKAILSLNDKFICYIEEAKNDVIDLSNFDYESLDGFVNYLYSGNEDHLLMRPSLSMMQCLKHFDCDAIKEFCIKEEIQLLSKINAETQKFHWHIADFLDKDEFVITSPPLRAMRTIWKLTLSMNRNDTEKFLSLYAEIADGEKPSKFCLEFCLLNESKEPLLPRRLLRFDGCCDNDFIMKYYVAGHKFMSLSGALCIFFRVKTSTGKVETKKGCHDMLFTLPVREHAYKNLSVKMENLLRKKRYSDIVLYVRSKQSIEAHKAILATRSPGFKRKIDKSLLDNEYKFVEEFDFVFLELCIDYIYSGIFSEAMKSKASSLYDLSAEDKLDIPSLHVDSWRYMNSVEYVLNNINTMKL